MKKILVVALLLAVLALAGCAQQAENMGAGLKTACFATQAVIKQSMELDRAQTGAYPPLSTVVAKTGAKCSGGGVYSFDQASGQVSCSVHGHQ